MNDDSWFTCHSCRRPTAPLGSLYCGSCVNEVYRKALNNFLDALGPIREYVTGTLDIGLHAEGTRLSHTLIGLGRGMCEHERNGR